MYRGLGAVRNYGIVMLFALLILNGATLWALHFVEESDLRNELIGYMETVPIPDVNRTEQTIDLPENIIALRTKASERVGFYETSIVGKDFLVYADPNKHYTLMKSEEEIQKETLNFAIAIGVLYLGEVVLLLGWWFFLRAKVRNIFESM